MRAVSFYFSQHICFCCLERDQYQLSTLSHVINARAQGYQELPDWPEEAPDASVRNVDVPKDRPENVKAKAESRRKFYSSSDGNIALITNEFVVETMY